MSLLDDARELAENCPIETDRGGRGECHYCVDGNYEDGYLSGSPTLPDVLHKPDCPWLSMPKIVAALEAIEAVSEPGVSALEVLTMRRQQMTYKAMAEQLGMSLRRVRHVVAVAEARARRMRSQEPTP